MCEQTLQRAKRIITEEVEKAGCRVVKVILFGSRARGDARADSDWDFLVVVDRDIPPAVRREILGGTSVHLVRHGIVADILIHSLSNVATHQDDVGHIAYYALKEGAEV
jgi:predicted nucleotidyltransferase